MKKSTITINPKTAWLMGVDPVATGVRLQNKRTAFSLTREGSLDELVVTYQRSRESAERDQPVPPLQLQYLYDNRTNIQKKECSFFYLQECAKAHYLCLQTGGWWLTGFFLE